MQCLLVRPRGQVTHSRHDARPFLRKAGVFRVGNGDKRGGLSRGRWLRETPGIAANCAGLVPASQLGVSPVARRSAAIDSAVVRFCGVRS